MSILPILKALREDLRELEAKARDDGDRKAVAFVQEQIKATTTRIKIIETARGIGVKLGACIIFLCIVLFSGCQTVNGISKDVRSLANHVDSKIIDE